MEVGFCGNLGKEGKETGAPWTCLCKPACLADLLMISQKASASQESVSQPQVEEVDAAATGAAAVVWGGQSPRLKQYVWAEQTADCGQDRAGAPRTH